MNMSGLLSASLPRPHVFSLFTLAALDSRLKTLIQRLATRMILILGLYCPSMAGYPLSL